MVKTYVHMVIDKHLFDLLKIKIYISPDAPVFFGLHFLFQFVGHT